MTKAGFAQSLAVAAGPVVPVVAAAITFSAYILAGNDLEASTVRIVDFYKNRLYKYLKAKKIVGFQRSYSLFRDGIWYSDDSLWYAILCRSLGLLESDSSIINFLEKVLYGKFS